MGFSDIFKGVAGAVGGAARGAAPAYADIMQGQQRRKEFDTSQADLRSYRDATLAQDQSQHAATLAETQTNNRWQRALDRRQQMIDRKRADTERVRADADLVRANMASRRDTDREEYGARMSRAERAAGRAGPNMSIDQLDRIAKLEGFTDYGQVVGVLQTGGQSVPAPGVVANPGESGLESMMRIRSQPGFSSFSDEYSHEEPDPYNEEVTKVLGR